MGFWGGVERGLEVAKKDKLNKEATELASRREERAEATFKIRESEESRNQFKFLNESLGGGLSLPGLGGGSSTDKSKSGKSTKQMMKVLKTIGVAPEQLATLHASGGTDAATQSNVERAYLIATKLVGDIDNPKFRSQNKSAAELLGEMIDSAVYTNPTETPIDDAWWTKFEDDYSMVITEENKARFGEVFVTGGEVDFLNRPTLIEKGSIPDIMNLQKLATTNVTNQADYDLSNIREIESTIQGVMSTGENFAQFAGVNEGEDVGQTNAKFIKEFLSERSGVIIDAQKKFTDNNNPQDLYGIYGTSYVDLLKRERPEVQTNLLGDSFLPTQQVPMNVGNMFTYQYLYRLGIVKDGMVVTVIGPDGNLVTQTVGADS